MGRIIVLDGSVALLPEPQPLLFPFAWQLPLRRLLHLNDWIKEEKKNENDRK